MSAFLSHFLSNTEAKDKSEFRNHADFFWNPCCFAERLVAGCGLTDSIGRRSHARSQQQGNQCVRECPGTDQPQEVHNRQCQRAPGLVSLRPRCIEPSLTTTTGKPYQRKRERLISMQFYVCERNHLRQTLLSHLVHVPDMTILSLCISTRLALYMQQSVLVLHELSMALNLTILFRETSSPGIATILGHMRKLCEMSATTKAPSR